MQLIQETPDLSAYLAADEAIDHHHPLVRETAARLAAGATDSYDYARAAFEFVRDTIPHSQDSGDLRVTWRASDATIAWAQGVIDAHAGLPTILTTHSLLAIESDQTTPLRTPYGEQLW